jgi:hydroxymethylbilane synthase
MSRRTVLRLGTRGSALAVAQSQLVAGALQRYSGLPVELVTITTYGDTNREPLETIGGTGVFVTALRHALLADEVDLAVHSYKDLPTGVADGLVVAAVPAREDPRDVLVTRDGRGLRELLRGARIGGSVRRAAQLRALGLGLEPEPIRGNVDTRLRKVADGVVDAVVLAQAGLVRLGRAGEASEVLDPAIMLPAPAQGALAVECRAADTELRTWLAGLDDTGARAEVTAERALLAALEAGCSAPIGALAVRSDGAGAGADLTLTAVVAAPDGHAVLRRTATGTGADATGLGVRLAATLLADGAAALADLGVSRDPAGGSHPSVPPVTSVPEGGTVSSVRSSTTTERVS